MFVRKDNHKFACVTQITLYFYASVLLFNELNN